MAAANVNSSTSPALPPGRVMAIDALRGFDMFWIFAGGSGLFLAFLKFIVNPLPGWFERQFDHVEWEGFAAWDLIMPLFMFIVGAAMPFSFSKRMQQGAKKGDLYVKVIRRTVILFVLGMVAQGNLLAFNLSKLHVYCNTLQAIAAGYLVSAVFLLEMRLRAQIIATATLLILYWLLMAFVPAPGYGMGALEPKANLALWVDEAILGRFRDGTAYTWILSSLPFAATVMLGVFSGQILRSGESKVLKLLYLVGAGAACLAAGWAWSFPFPIIKHLYTSSMVLWAGGWCYLLLALFFLLIDMWGFRKWAFPFVVIGMNAIVAYMAGDFINFGDIGNAFVGGLARHLGDYGPFVKHLAGFLVGWWMLYYMYRKGTFLRI